MVRYRSKSIKRTSQARSSRKQRAVRKAGEKRAQESKERVAHLTYQSARVDSENVEGVWGRLKEASRIMLGAKTISEDYV